MSIYGAVQIETSGKIIGAMSSSGYSCIVFDANTVEVDATNQDNLDLLKMINLGKYYYYDLQTNLLTERVSQTTQINKTELIADGVDTIDITNAPQGLFSISTLNEALKDIPIEHADVIESGNIFNNDTFSTTIPGIYYIRIEAFPYLDFEATIEAI